MELSFQNAQFSYLNRVLQKVQEQEELAETVVPDSYPDILSVVDAYAEPMIRGKECREGSVVISGGIQGGIMYLPDDHSYARNLDFYIPFTMKVEHSTLTEHAQVQCSVRVRTVDGCAVNSRKAMLRVSLECFVSAFEEATEVLSMLQETPDCLETRQAVYELLLPIETEEKSFAIQDTLDVPLDLPPVIHICKMSNRVIVREQKLVGNKAVFKGAVETNMLYLGEDDQYHICQRSFPFSQYCELQNEYDRETLELLPVLTGCNWDNGGEDEVRQIGLTIHILMQCTVSGNRKIDTIEDAYCINGTLAPQWTAHHFNTCLDQQTFHQVLRKTQEQPFKEIVDTAIYMGYPRYELQNGVAHITTPIQIHVLGYCDNNILTGACDKADDIKELPSADCCNLIADVSIAGNPESHITGTGTETTCELSLTVSCCTEQCLNNLAGGSIEPCSNQEGETPSLILRTVNQETSLWKLAKHYRTRESAIQTANHLETDVLDTAQILLIPMM